jgi:putative membrane protein
MSPVFTTLIREVVAIGIYSAVIVWLTTAYPRFTAPLGPSVLSLLGIILGLLLVFRTNTAYDRWWEGRRLWGQLVNVSRTLARQLAVLLPLDAHQERQEYASLLQRFPGALAKHLRRNLEEKPPIDHTEPPFAIIDSLVHRVHGDIRAGRLPREAMISLTPMLAAFDDIAGACDRIHKTPIPLSYSAYIKQFVLLFALLVPFALAREFHYGTVVASMFLFFSTMGIDLLATEVEEPFGTDRNDLPLGDISATIVHDVGYLLAP